MRCGEMVGLADVVAQRASKKSLGEACKHQFGGCDEYEGLAVCGVIFLVFFETAVVREPAESPFHDPAPRQDFESVQFGAFDHLQAQAAARQEFLELLGERAAGITAIDRDQA